MRSPGGVPHEKARTDVSGTVTVLRPDWRFPVFEDSEKFNSRSEFALDGAKFRVVSFSVRSKYLR